MILTLRHEHSLTAPIALKLDVIFSGEHSLSPESLEALRSLTAPIALKLDVIFSAVSQLKQQGAQQAMSQKEALDRLAKSVAANTSGIASAKQTIAGLAQQIRDNADNPTALTALADTLDNDDAGLADAIVANTPAAPPAPLAA